MEKDLRDIPKSPYYVENTIQPKLSELRRRVSELREQGTLSGAALKKLSNYFRIKNIYHSNAIEGNSLDLGETRLVVEQGLTITGKPLKDTLEAKNLAHALNLFEELADRQSDPVRGIDLRNLHAAVLRGIQESEAGKYRDVRVEISGSPHKPPGPESVAPEMEKLTEWLKGASTTEGEVAQTEDPLVVACTAHAWLAYIHPFIDGNGRVSRLLLNLLLLRFGYPIAVITKEDRLRYYDALKESDNGDLTAFCVLTMECVEESLEVYLQAAQEKQADQDWATSIRSKLKEKNETRLGNEFNVWRSSMEMLRATFREKIEILNATTNGMITCQYRDFGYLDFEQWFSLKNFRTVKKAWAFGLSFRSIGKQQRYVFFHGFANQAFRPNYEDVSVTLHLSHEERPSEYERVDRLNRSDLPEICEIGYSPKLEQHVVRTRANRCSPLKLEDIVKNLFSEIVQRQF